MSSIFYRCVLLASWVISQISRLFFRPHTTRKPLHITRYEPPAAKLPEQTRILPRPTNTSTFHDRVIEFLRAQFPDALTVIDGPNNTLRIFVAESKRSKAIAYHQMNDLLEERYRDGSLANITELDLSVPLFESKKTLAYVSYGSRTIPTPNLTSFKWSGSLLLFPRPWRTLAQLDFSAIVKLCLFEHSPELKEFTAMTISARITEFATVPERAGFQEVAASRSLSQSYLHTVSSAWPRKPSNQQVKCTKLRFIAISTCVNVKPLWDALAPCKQLSEIYLRATYDCAYACTSSILWRKWRLSSVNIVTPLEREVVGQWIPSSLGGKTQVNVHSQND